MAVAPICGRNAKCDCAKRKKNSAVFCRSIIQMLDRTKGTPPRHCNTISGTLIETSLTVTEGMRNGYYTKDNRSTVAGMAKAITDAAKVRDAIKKRTQRRGSPRSAVQLWSAGLRMALQRRDCNVSLTNHYRDPSIPLRKAIAALGEAHRALGAIQLTTAEEAAARLRLHIGALTELAATMAAEPAASLFPFAANLHL